MVQYVGVNCRPEVRAPVQLVAPGRDPTTKDEYKSLKRVINHLREMVDTVLNFANLDLYTCRLVLFTEESFANARDLNNSDWLRIGKGRRG